MILGASAGSSGLDRVASSGYQHREKHSLQSVKQKQALSISQEAVLVSCYFFPEVQPETCLLLEPVSEVMAGTSTF